jgi:hypothetical protein
LDATPGTKWTADLMDRAATAAAKNPNHYWLLADAAYMYDAPPLGRADDDMAASMYLTAMQDRYLTGTGFKTRAVTQLAWIMYALGRSDITAQILLPERAPLDEEEARPLMNSLCELGQYQTALDFNKVQEKFLRKYASNFAIRTIFAAAMLGQTDVVNQAITNQRKALDSDHLMPLAEAYRDTLAGQSIDSKKLAAAMPDAGARWQYLILLCQLDLASANQTHRDDAADYLTRYPATRTGWILLDAYDRQKPRAEMADFYRTLQWLYPDDAWVVQATSDGLARNAGAKPPDIAAITAALKDFPARHWSPKDGTLDAAKIEETQKLATPWAVASALRQLTDKGDFSSAKDLALRYNNFCAHGNLTYLSIWANHLIYKVSECERAKK